MSRVIGCARNNSRYWYRHVRRLETRADSGMMSECCRWREQFSHSSLGPRVLDPPAVLATIRKLKSRHRLGEGVVVLAKSVPGGLHHEYSMATPRVA